MCRDVFARNRKEESKTGVEEMTENGIGFEAELRLTLEGKWNREEEQYTVEKVRNPEIGEMTYTVNGGISDEDTKKLRKKVLNDFKSVRWIADISSALKKGDTERLAEIASQFDKS